jgi:hypothetical protein
MLERGMSRRVPMLLGLAAAVLSLAARGESTDSPPAKLGPGRVVVVPVNLAVRPVAEVEPGVDPVWRELLQYLGSEREGVIALGREGAAALWDELMVEAAAQGSPPDLYDAYARFARRVAEQVEFGDIVFPTLVTRAARIRGRTASWDGAREPIEVPGQFSETIDTLREGKIVLTRHGANGEIGAASLHVAVFSSSGELRFERIGGLVLLQRLVQPQDDHHLELSVVPRTDAFAHPKPLREGIAATFAAK